MRMDVRELTLWEREAKRRRAMRLMDAIVVAAYPWSDKDDRKATLEAIEQDLADEVEPETPAQPVDKTELHLANIRLAQQVLAGRGKRGRP